MEPKQRKISDRLVEDVRDTVQDAGREPGSVAGGLIENPLAMLLGGLAAGILIGSVLPLSHLESKRIPPLTEALKDLAKAAGQAALRRGSQTIKGRMEGGRPLQS